jgi:hypothetical protein
MPHDMRVPIRKAIPMHQRKTLLSFAPNVTREPTRSTRRPQVKLLKTPGEDGARGMRK